MVKRKRLSPAPAGLEGLKASRAELEDLRADAVATLAALDALIRQEDGGRSRRKPNRKRLTDTNVTGLPVKSKQYLCWDDPKGKDAANGLAILVSPTGIRSFRAVFYFAGSTKPVWKHIGRVGEMTLAEAREATREARRQAQDGIDPRAADPRRSDNFKTLLEAWVKHEQTGKKGNSSAAETHKLMLKHCAAWLTRPVATIRADEIELLLWAIRDGSQDRRPTPYMANRMFAHLRSLFGWAARPGGPLKASPMVGMTKPFGNGKRRERTWFKGAAADDAIKAVWRAADKIGGEQGQYLKVLLLSGKRPWGRENGNGLGAMAWEHIDKDWLWDAPESKSKNKRLHGVPLSALAQRVLSPRRVDGYVFEPIDADDLMAQVRKLTGIEDFILHGIRHLVETKVGELGVPPHVRDVLFDHAPARGAGKGYDHHSYVPEMRQAMEGWAAYVEQLVGAEGIARLR